MILRAIPILALVAVSLPAATLPDYLEALRRDAAGDKAGAISKLEAVLAADPTFARAYYRLAVLDPGAGDRFARMASPYACLGRIELARIRKEYAVGESEGRACANVLPEAIPVYDRWMLVAREAGHVNDLAPLMAHEADDHPASAARQFAAGYAYTLAYFDSRETRQYESGLRFLGRAHNLAPDDNEIDDALFYLHARQDGGQAAEAARRLVARAHSSGDDEWTYRAAARLGQIHRDEARFSEAISALDEAIRGAHSLGRVEGEERFLEIKAGCLFRLARYEESIAAYRESLALAESLGNRVLQGNILGWLGELYRATADYAQALEFTRRAMDLAREGNRPQQLALFSKSLAFLWLETGLPDRALTASREGLAALGNTPSPRLRGRVLTDIGNILTQLGRTKEAAETLGLAITAAQGTKDAIAETEARILRSDLLASSGQLSEAANDLSAAEELLRATPVPAYTARLRLVSGKLALNGARWQDATLAFGEALRSAEEIHSLPLVWQGRTGLSNVYWKQSRLEEALVERRKAIDVIEVIRSRLLATEQKAGFLSARIQLYKDVARLHMELGQTAQAFEMTERGRVRALLDLVESSREAPPDQSPEFQSQLAALERLTAARNAAASDPDRIRKAEMELQSATDAYQAALAVGGQSSVASASLAEIQARLAPDAALLHYSLDAPDSSLFVIRRDSVHRYRLQARAVVDGQVRAARALLSTQPNRLTQTHLRERLESLYRLLVGPAAAELAKVRQLVIVADGTLQYLPFEALVSPGGAPGWVAARFLVRRYQIEYAPSASLRLGDAASARPSGVRSLLAYGDPVSRGTVPGALPALPFSRREVEQIAAFYPSGQRRVVAGEAATETALKKDARLPEATVLHFAVHGVVDEHWPNMSGLVFSTPPSTAAGKDDGVFRVYEILRTRLKAEVVVLSACDTSLGAQVEGEGLASLRRAFLMAGAKSILSSLWKVDDQATADLMIDFHRELNRANSGAGAALRSAQLARLSDESRGHPYYWAAFTLMTR